MQRVVLGHALDALLGDDVVAVALRQMRAVHHLHAAPLRVCTQLPLAWHLHMARYALGSLQDGRCLFTCLATSQLPGYDRFVFSLGDKGIGSSRKTRWAYAPACPNTHMRNRFGSRPAAAKRPSFRHHIRVALPHQLRVCRSGCVPYLWPRQEQAHIHAAGPRGSQRGHDLAPRRHQPQPCHVRRRGRAPALSHDIPHLHMHRLLSATSLPNTPPDRGLVSTALPRQALGHLLRPGQCVPSHPYKHLSQKVDLIMLRLRQKVFHDSCPPQMPC